MKEALNGIRDAKKRRSRKNRKSKVKIIMCLYSVMKSRAKKKASKAEKKNGKLKQSS